MADKKDATASKAASKTSVAKSPSTKDVVAEAYKILRKSYAPRKHPEKDGKGKRRAGIGKRNKKARAARKELRAAGKKPQKLQKRPASDGKEDAGGPPAKRVRSKTARRFLCSGIMKFSRPYKYQKGVWRCSSKKARKATPKKPRIVKKEIGGDKNGGFRMVLLKKRRQNYPTTDPIRPRRSRGVFKKHKRYTRSSLKPGTICILLAGIHKGRRVVLLKVLRSGLLMINGPYRVNGCPLRRVSQNFVIATRTRLNLTDVKIPTHLDDNYFKRIRAAKKAKKEEGDIFSTKKEKYVPSEQRKADQKVMDDVVMKAIKAYGKHGKQKTMLIRYLKAMFGLRRNQNPHNLRF